jgi:hypothetical protein
MAVMTANRLPTMMVQNTRFFAIAWAWEMMKAMSSDKFARESIPAMFASFDSRATS